MKDLSPRQKMFVQEYLVDLNATQAAVRAGYSKNTNLLSNSEVRKAVECAQAERIKRIEATQDFVLSTLMEVAEKCVSSEYFNPSGANKALELIGKHLGMFKEKVDVGENVNIAEELKIRLEKFNISSNSNWDEHGG